MVSLICVCKFMNMTVLILYKVYILFLSGQRPSISRRFYLCFMMDYKDAITYTRVCLKRKSFK
jgi:hypothetical protein